MAHDLVIRNGLVVDGTGAPGRRADVAVSGGRIAAIGERLGDDGDAREEVDATGCVVAPGFVDPHTHLDAQLAWDPAAQPTCLHGVTTVVMGLCGFGVAPCPEDGGEYLLRSLEVVEEIPFESTSQAVPFEWRTFGDWLDWLERRDLGVNAAGFVPHSALRFAVMGDRARGEAATEQDRMALVAELRAALDAGAVGLASSRGPNHKDAYGDPVPSRFADDDELVALVAACEGRVWQINVKTKFAGDVQGLLQEVDGYARWTQQAGARLSWTPFHADPGNLHWKEILEHTAELQRGGIDVLPQVASQPITTTFTFDRFSYVAFVPGWAEALAGFFDLDPAAKVARLGDEQVRATLRSAPGGDAMFAPNLHEWVVLVSPSRPDLVGRSLASAAEAEGSHPVDLLLDTVVADDLRTVVQVPALNRDPDAAGELIAADHTLLGLGDSGAHVTSISNYSQTTHLLAVRCRDRGELSLEAAIHRITERPARFLGLAGRGVLAEGAPADVTVFDLDRLALGPLEVAHDLPGGAPRLWQAATGYRAVLVNGVVTVADDARTGAAPGQVVRVTS